MSRRRAPMPDPDVEACRRCPALVDSRTQIVNGRGDPEATILLVGEAPGRYEDDAGRPFIGQSGELLETALRDRGWDPDAVRITNLVRCRPPENRDPHVAERRNCRDHLEAEVAAVDPEVVLALGRIPATALLDRSVRVSAEAASTATVHLGGQPRTVVIGLHPAAVLYDRTQTDAFESALDRALELADGA